MKTLNKMHSTDEANRLIAQKRVLIIAGSENALAKIHKGSWIGGTIPYFMTNEGGCFDEEHVFITDLTEVTAQFKITTYDKSQIPKLTDDRFDNGFTFLLIPGLSDVLKSYSLYADGSTELLNVPTLGWVTGVSLKHISTVKPLAYDGISASQFHERIVALHIELPDNLIPDLEILNIFEPNKDDVIEFEQDGFLCSTCLINGEKVNLAEYLEKNNIDTRFPIIADYAGAKINASFQHVDSTSKTVNFYAPVRKGTKYSFAKPTTNYVTTFKQQMPSDTDVILSFNCILNFLYSELEGEKTGTFTGPFTFGEIAYTLLNQTMVYLKIVTR